MTVRRERVGGGYSTGLPYNLPCAYMKARVYSADIEEARLISKYAKEKEEQPRNDCFRVKRIDLEHSFLDTDGMSLLSIVIPAYNEEKTIREIIRSAADVDLGPGNNVEVLVVDDGSTDRTAEFAREVLSAVGGRLLKHEQNRGKGAAFRTGLAAAQGVAVIVQDADLEYDPLEIPRCVEPILAGAADVVYGSRRLNSANVAHSSWLFFAGGVLVTKVFNLLYGYNLTDEPTCYKSFRRSVIDSIGFSSDGFEWEPEVTARLALKGVPIKEVPISYNPRGSAEGKKITGLDGMKALWMLVRLRFLG